MQFRFSSFSLSRAPHARGLYLSRYLYLSVVRVSLASVLYPDGNRHVRRSAFGPMFAGCHTMKSSPPPPPRARKRD